MSIFKKIFGKKEFWVPLDISFLGTDIHSHLVPAIDDGSTTIGESITLAQGLKELGYKKAVTTPHIMSDFYRNTPAIIRKGLANLNSALVKNKVDIEVIGAAEYYIDFDFIAKIDQGELLTFGDNYILVEFSFVEPPRVINEVFFALQTNGYKPVLAHPERYMYWHDQPKELFALKDRDVLFQINLLSLMGIYGPGSAIMGETLLNNSMVEWMGSDLHNMAQLSFLQNYMVKEHVAEKLLEQTFLNQTL